MYSDLWAITPDEDPETCSRCNRGIGEHECWRRQIQLAPDINSGYNEPIRTHDKHEGASLTPSKVLTLGYVPRPNGS
jgi:hypothetical protein